MLAQVGQNKHTLCGTRDVLSAAVEISCTSIGHVHCAVVVLSSYKYFLTSNMADGKKIQLTIRILSRPNLSITVTVVKPGKSTVGDRNDEVESGSQSPGSNQAFIPDG